MQRLLQSFAVIALASLCLGCTLPQTGLDYCSPTVDANGVPIGGFMMRQGSVLGGMPGVPVYAQQPTPARPTGVPTPAGTPAGTPTPADTPTPAAMPTAGGDGSKAQPVSATMPATAAATDPDAAEQAQ